MFDVPGLSIPKPEFMLSKRQQAKIYQSYQAPLLRDEDVDWTPKLEREQNKRCDKQGRHCTLASVSGK